jgi:hypothetical protein
LTWTFMTSWVGKEIHRGALPTRRVLMTGEGVDLALAANKALIARVRTAHAAEQLGTELERLLVEWCLVCRITGAQRR